MDDYFSNVFFYSIIWFEKYTRQSIDLVEDAPQVLPPSRIIQPILAADLSSDPILLGASHYVFVGKVISQTETVDYPMGPRTQYSVEVISNIKGEVSGTITVEQEGGMKDGTMQTIEDAFLFLEPGSTYILATRHVEPTTAYTLIAHKNAGKLITNDASLDNTQLKEFSDKDEKVRILKAAYPKEKLLDVDVEQNHALNSFQSLPPEAKTAAQGRADMAKVEMEKERQNAAVVQ